MTVRRLFVLALVVFVSYNVEGIRAKGAGGYGSISMPVPTEPRCRRRSGAVTK